MSPAMLSLSLYLTEDIRRIEAAATDLPLMQRAGRAAAELAATICLDQNAPILILAGPGNNGGDAFEAARLLRERFFAVRVVFTGEIGKLPADAANAFQHFTEAGGTITRSIPTDTRWSLVIDGLFGIGLTREIRGAYADMIDQANALAQRDACPLLALDCPSGLDADTGARQETCIRASHTITFIAGKPGLYTADGPDFAGTVSIASLDLDLSLFTVPTTENSSGQIVSCCHFSEQLQTRPRNSHKGCFGNAGILGGTASMVGAALLAGRSALRLGCGRVYLGLLDEKAPTFDPSQPELMLRPPKKLLLSNLTALACGPGLGTDAEAVGLLKKACRLDTPLVLDADALNCMASHKEMRNAVTKRVAPTLLTPHPAEAARLLDSTIRDIQNNRIAAALSLASEFNAHVALKGCGTVIVTSSGQWFINTSGNPGLATAGSGDVLTGFITALLAQGWPPQLALLAAVHLHGCAADHLVAQNIGPIGLTAGELIDSARVCFNRWTIQSDGKASTLENLGVL